mmetsp:Transcript_1894/g.5666  ORF Transcript_1894/g.5666 Transcript_1894/m.5666 type:complete len:236 (-) Transcript_1894:1233-1940(-)
MPASVSKLCVPTSKRDMCPVASQGSRSSWQSSRSTRRFRNNSSRPNKTPACGPKNLYGEHAKKSQPMATVSINACGAKCTMSTKVNALPLDNSFALAQIPRTSWTLPTPLEAPPAATRRVRVSMTPASRSGRASKRHSGLPDSQRDGATGNQRTSAPHRSASCTHVQMFAPWLIGSSTTLSPGLMTPLFPNALETWYASAVMVGPKTTSCGAQFIKSAMAPRARTTASPTRSLVA